GRAVRADYRAIPAVTFTDPQIATVGKVAGEGLAEGRWRLPARLSAYQRPRRGGVPEPYAQPRTPTGGRAVGVRPQGGEWLQQLTLAIRANVPIVVLRDTIQPYPTFSEAVYFAARNVSI